MTAPRRTCWLLLLLHVCPSTVLAYPCEVGCRTAAIVGSLATPRVRQKSHQLAPTAMTLNARVECGSLLASRESRNRVFMSLTRRMRECNDV